MKLYNETEIRTRLNTFIPEHRDFNYEKGQSQVFWSDFFQCFGVPANIYGLWFENAIDRKFIDAFYPKHFIIEQKSEGRDLDDAYTQALDYANRLEADKRPRFIVVCDFKEFRVKDLSTLRNYEFNYSQIEDYINLWREILGEEKDFFEEITVNIEAGNIMADLHDALKASGYDGRDLEVLLVRLMFCLFADDTGIFEKDIFTKEIKDTPAKLLGAHLSQIFDILNTDEKVRLKNLDQSLMKFPYVNGGLFKETLKQVSFDEKMKDLLYKACCFNWAKISPIIFGSIFQHAMNPTERRNFGAHFTTVENIKKVIDPLFMQGLYKEFDAILIKHRGDNRRFELQKLMKKIGDLVIFDPACGCGNFLAVAYTELRLLENRILVEAYKGGNFDNVRTLINVKISHFYGVEIEEFASYVARVSMWLTEQQMFMDLTRKFGTYLPKLPLDDEACIVHGNSLRLDWDQDVLQGVVPDYIVGNPPFVGKKFQSATQKEDITMIFAGNTKAKSLDYVCCWYKKATNYIKATWKDTQCAFVSTNSICQGEQTAILWKDLFNNGVKINFAHQTFKWTTEIKGGAAVYVIVVGFASFDRDDKRLFVYADPTKVTEYSENPVTAINAYLVEGTNILIESRTKPLCDVPIMSYGNMPIDGGYLLLTPEEKDELLSKEPLAEKWIFPFISAHEFVHNQKRYCLWLDGISPKELNALPLVKSRVEAVRSFRMASTRKETIELASYPTQFGFVSQTNIDDLVLQIPRHSSENRNYIPMGIANKSIIADSMNAVFNAPKWLFAILTSRMHMAWMRSVAGRLKGDYRYSNTLVYNNFPFPDLDDTQKAKLDQLAEDILTARSAYPDSSLADLYDQTTMPPNLRKAHTTLDTYVDKLYTTSLSSNRSKGFESDAKRVEMLLLKYKALSESDLLIKTEVKKVRGKKK
ncbi:MAG: DNA methyltransferase [Brevinema sp.]